MGAYDRLKAVQKDRESFSQVIKRVIVKPLDFQSFLKNIRKTSISEEATMAIEAQIKKRHVSSG